MYRRRAWQVHEKHIPAHPSTDTFTLCSRVSSKHTHTHTDKPDTHSVVPAAVNPAGQPMRGETHTHWNTKQTQHPFPPKAGQSRCMTLPSILARARVCVCMVCSKNKRKTRKSVQLYWELKLRLDSLSTQNKHRGKQKTGALTRKRLWNTADFFTFPPTSFWT